MLIFWIRIPHVSLSCTAGRTGGSAGVGATQEYGEMLVHPGLIAGKPPARVALVSPPNSRALCEILRHSDVTKVDYIERLVGHTPVAMVTRLPAF